MALNDTHIVVTHAIHHLLLLLAKVSAGMCWGVIHTVNSGSVAGALHSKVFCLVPDAELQGHAQSCAHKYIPCVAIRPEQTISSTPRESCAICRVSRVEIGPTEPRAWGS